MWAALLAVACTRREPSHDAGPAPALSRAPASIPPAAAVGLDSSASPAACSMGHLGPLVDLGDASARPWLEPPSSEYESFERDGDTWLRVLGTHLAVRFGGPTAALAEDVTVVDLRVRSRGAKHVIVVLDGKLLGQAALSRGETKIVTVRGPATLGAGTHELGLRFTGGPRREPSAEIDWVHVGAPDEGAAYVAPTHSDALATYVLAGVARYGFSLRGPSWLRCVAALPEHSTVEAELGMLGEGEADVEARVLRDRMAPLVLGTVHVRTGEPWREASWTVGLPARALGAVELAVTTGTPRARVLLAEVRVRAMESVPKAPSESARNAVIVVLGSTAPWMLATYGGHEPAPRLSGLAAEGEVFERHRAASTWPATSIASMLSGLPGPGHGVDERTALPASILTFIDAARQAGVATAFFTANPTTFADYGFSRGFETFLATPPGGGNGAALFDEAARWLREAGSRRFVLVVHARGAHPPWDAAGDVLKRLPPEGYLGPVEPLHAGEILAKARRTPPVLRLTDADRTRAAALQSLAVAEHDAGLGRLLDALRDSRHDTDTLVVVTSDVGLPEGGWLSDGDELDEATLAVPLVLRGPGIAAKTRTSIPSTHVDLAKTTLLGLGLAAPATFLGTDLRALSRSSRPLLAALGARRALVWENFVLRSDSRRETLCDRSLDSTCASDASASSPLALELLRRAAEETPATVKAEPGLPSAGTIAALRAWGR